MRDPRTESPGPDDWQQPSWPLKGVPIYRAARHDSPDPVTFRGRRFAVTGRASALLKPAVSAVVLLGYLSAWMSVYALVPLLVVVIVASAWIVRRSIRRPTSLTITAEGFTVCDLAGASTALAWPDVSELSVTRSPSPARDTVLHWTGPGNSPGSANVGPSIPADDVRRAVNRVLLR